MKISIVVAMGTNKVIGKDGKMPWYIPADLKRFKQITIGHPVVMGRKTYESVIKRLGHSLADRTNIVLTKSKSLVGDCLVADSWGKAMSLASKAKGSDEVFVIGGGEIYELALPFTRKIYVTLIKTEFEGDTFFPAVDMREWELVDSSSQYDKNVLYSYFFDVFERGKTKKVVDPRFAKDKEYKAVLKEIESKGECPFCPDNFKYHKHPILTEYGDWFLTKISWPYKNAKEHFIIISKTHKEQLSELDTDDWRDVHVLAKWAIQKFGLKGGALALRFGDTEYTGATVCHLHFHLITPKKGKAVSFPIG